MSIRGWAVLVTSGWPSSTRLSLSMVPSSTIWSFGWMMPPTLAPATGQVARTTGGVRSTRSLP